METKTNKENLDPIDTLLLDLKKSIKSKEMVIFCGAGISFNSGLPLANDLVRYVLEKLSVSKEETETIINSNLPFEAFIETLREGRNVDKIFDIFDFGIPNTNHFLLAKLAKAKYVKTICTTNFDQLIEEAFKNVGLIREVDFQVFYKEDDLGNIKWDDNKIRLIKIHGSVDDKENMAVTLQQIASKELSVQRMSIIEHIFSKGTHKSVLVLGYSCSDVFDISPQIENIQKNHKNIFFIDHSEKEQTVKDIKNKNGKNPFQHFTGSKCVLYNTDELVYVLWEILEPEDNYFYPDITKDNALWKKFIDDTLLETEDKSHIVGTIFFHISDYKKAIVFHERALSFARKIGDKKSEGYHLGNLGTSYNGFGDYQKAIAFHEKALNIARAIGDKKREGYHLGNLGYDYNNLGDYQKSIAFHNNALNIARAIGDKRNEGIWLGNLGYTHASLGGYQKAIEFHEKALNIARAIGDKRNEGTWLAGLGNAYRNLGDYKKAIAFHEKALGIARDIGDKKSEGDQLGNIGNDYNNLGDYQKSIAFYDNALSIARKIGNKKSEGIHLGNLGSAYSSLRDNQKAIEFHEQALSIARGIGNKSDEIAHLDNLGFDYNNLGGHKKAIAFHEQSLSIAIGIGDKQGEGICLYNLGYDYNNLGDYNKAIEYYEHSLSITKEIGDKQGEGTCLGCLGNAYNSLGYHQKAIVYYEQALVIFKPILGDVHPYVKRFEDHISRKKNLKKTIDFII